MADHVITAEMAAKLYVEAIERHELPAWIVFWEQPSPAPPPTYPARSDPGACATPAAVSTSGRLFRVGTSGATDSTSAYIRLAIPDAFSMA
jgi:hypothetical protein